MDYSLQTVTMYASQLTPILLVVLLVVLIIILIRVLLLLGNVNKTVNKVNTALDVTNDYLEEFKIPVRAIVNVSMSVEALRAATEQTISSFYDKMSENAKKVVDFFRQLWDSIAQIKSEEEAAKQADSATVTETKND